jgi:hypothetical protein
MNYSRLGLGVTIVTGPSLHLKVIGFINGKL